MSEPESMEAVFEAAAAALAARLAAAGAAPPLAPDAAAAADAGPDLSSLDAALAALDAAEPAEAVVATEPAKASTLTPELREKIIQQVEFYFSDENLPTDEFLLGRVKQNKQGWGALVPVVCPCRLGAGYVMPHLKCRLRMSRR